MKKRRLNPISPNRSIKSDTYDRMLMDGLGVFFLEAEQILRLNIHPRPVHDPFALNIMRASKFCHWCGVWRGSNHFLDPHHIIGGSGKCDLLADLMPLCRPCHDEVQSDKALLPAVLYAKWFYDRQRLSWWALTLLYGRALPEPDPQGRNFPSVDFLLTY